MSVEQQELWDIKPDELVFIRNPAILRVHIMTANPG